MVFISLLLSHRTQKGGLLQPMHEQHLQWRMLPFDFALGILKYKTHPKGNRMSVIMTYFSTHHIK